MSPVRIGGGQVVTPEGLRTGSITVEGDRIAQFSTETAGSDGDAYEIDATDLFASPGFFDIQINGGNGIDLATRPEGLWELGQLLPRYGVTSFLPTIVSSPEKTTDAALAAIGDRPHGYLGAEPIGLHLEGPMLNPDRRGAHRPNHLQLPGAAVITGWSRTAGVRLVTLAPELPGAITVIADLVDRGVTVAAGHSEATSGQTAAAMNAGLTGVTHLFNAMAPLNHRHPSLVATALASPSLVVGLIADGVHVHPEVVAVAWRAKGPSGIALVTDAVAPMGQAHGSFDFGGVTITSDSSGVRNAEGTLSGSNLSMDQAVRNLVSFTKCSVPDALMSASLTPADFLDEPQRGRIAAGALADLVLLNEDLQVQITMCGGEVVYVAPEADHRLAPQI